MSAVKDRALLFSGLVICLIGAVAVGWYPAYMTTYTLTYSRDALPLLKTIQGLAGFTVAVMGALSSRWLLPLCFAVTVLSFFLWRIKDSDDPFRIVSTVNACLFIGLGISFAIMLFKSRPAPPPVQVKWEYEGTEKK